jgi:hypothetical protein
MTERARLERGYRRLLACYPRSFRRENTEEMLAVLVAKAGGTRTRVGLAESANLIQGALRMRLCPAAPQPGTVRGAVRLMLAGAVAELALLITMVVTIGRVHAAVLARNPAAWHGALVHLTIDEALLPLHIGLWLWLAWANGRGQDWARMVSAACFGLATLGILGVLSQGAAAVAPADVIAATVVWALGLASVALIFTPASNPYYRPRLAPH